MACAAVVRSVGSELAGECDLLQQERVGADGFKPLRGQLGSYSCCDSEEAI